MKEFGEALRLLVERLSVLFDVFDLSYIISGISTFTFFIALGQLIGIDMKAFFKMDYWWVYGIFGVYVSGIISFSSGRWLRQSLSNILRRKDRITDFDVKFREILGAHNLTKDTIFDEYLLAGSKGSWRLYIRMWAELRHKEVALPSLQLVKKYWVMAATYDGLCISILLWCVYFIISSSEALGNDTWPLNLGLLISFILILFSAACMREASRYVDYQIEDVVATIAAIRANG